MRCSDNPKLPPDEAIIDIEGEVVSSLTVRHTEMGMSFGLQFSYPVVDDDDTTDVTPIGEG